MSNLCPCQSNQPYSHCCQPFHLGEQLPTTAEQLMRSRYSAYTQVNIDYIVKTTVPSQQALLDQVAMKTWGETTKWAGLEIISHKPAISKIHSMVEFKAYFETEEGKQAHHELSLFVKIDGRWYFVDPTVPLPTMKQPCVCGSGKKFKHCCGAFL
ncbi:MULTISPECIES: YchJ family protein [Glaesserella]|uniref:UPF0225 protein C5N92_08145 n=1 Tax=Glaesserella australis TaxID=2094024 RepID=A0A328BZ88_9PAST|nr:MULTISPECIES: YchJ family protein [Glaesserella]AUI66460.1 SEC-C motif-containing protein [Glaesserella sp. 15-184]RAL18402.1 hypothetical protein C5N92_08145 [Glaesserella australis]